MLANLGASESNGKIFGRENEMSTMISFTKRYIENGKQEPQPPALMIVEGSAGYGKTTMVRGYVQGITELELECALCCSSANDWEKHVPLIVWKDIFFQIAMEAGYGELMQVNMDERELSSQRIVSGKIPSKFAVQAGQAGHQMKRVGFGRSERRT